MGQNSIIEPGLIVELVRILNEIRLSVTALCQKSWGVSKCHNRGVFIIGSAAKHTIGPCGSFIGCAAAPHHIVLGLGHQVGDDATNARGVFIGHDIAVGRFMLSIQKPAKEAAPPAMPGSKVTS